MTFPAQNVTVDAKIKYDSCMISLEPITVSATVLAQLFLYLDSLRVDINAFLRTLDIEPETVRSPDAYIPIETYLHIQDEAARYINDPYLGLHMGEFAQPANWSILGYLMMNCTTLGEAFEKSGRYHRIIGNLITGRMEFGLGKVRVVYFTPPNAPQMSRHCFDSTFSSSLRLARTLSGLPLDPLEVTFIYPEPGSHTEYERIFNCPVRFGHKNNSMTLDMRMGNLPVRMANPSLLEHFEQYARDFIAQMERNDATTQAVTKIILARLDDESLSIEKVAREMAVSVRTLQKRLEAEGILFSDLLRDIRQRLAKKYLRENYSVEEITYMLGFSEPSAFRKSFKKWLGVTPREYRESVFTLHQA